MAQEVIFTFTNTHSSLLGEKTLQAEGLAVRVMPLPSSIGEGCGMCLRVAAEDAKTALALLRAAGAAPLGYFEARDGTQGKEYLPCCL